MFEVKEYVAGDGKLLQYGRLVDPSSKNSTSGKALFFIPGLGGSVKWALPFLERLLPAYPTIYGPDLRGFGLNLSETPIMNANVIPQDLEVFYQQIIVPAKHSEIVLCGISLGGILSTLMAVKNPERFSRLVLLAPAYRPHSKSFTLGYTLKNVLAFITKRHNAHTLLPYGLTEITRNPAILNDPQHSKITFPLFSAGFLLGVRSLCQTAFAQMNQLKIPTMMIIPGQDIVCDPVAMRQAFQKIPSSTQKTCQELPDSYHDVLLEAEHPEISDAILRWIGV